MRLIVRTALGFVLLGSLVVLGLSVWPGMLNDLLSIVVLLSLIWLPVGLIVSLVLAVLLHRRRQRDRLSRLPKFETITVFVVILVTVALVVFHVPRRIGFLASRSAFESMVAAAPQREYRGVPLDARLGIYRVDEYATDPRGGVFFRVYSGADGIGPDTMSYGFVKRPNSQGTPFGAAHYRVFPISGDWYWFRASDDWY